MARNILFLIALLGVLPVAVRGQSLERIVVFRDGSVAPLQITQGTVVWRHWPGGELTEEKIALADLDLLHFSPQPPTEILGRFESLIRDLGHERYGVRQQAERELLEMPSSVTPLLQSELQGTRDAEVRLRIRQLLKRLPSGPAKSVDVPADRIRTGSKDAVRGDLGDCVIEARLHGVSIKLTRSQVLQVRTSLPGRSELTPTVAKIAADTDEAFPVKTHTRLSFETDPAGKQLTPGDNIQKSFIPAGCTISTSIEGSFVSVNNYDVGGRSGGLSCATHQPRFQGDLTIRFCLPSFPAIDAGVYQAGFWIAAVSPNGTALEAYGQRGQLLGSVLTTSRNKDFLAIRSSVPISYIKIVPNPQIDPDYTIDDLVFTRPQPFSDGAMDRFTVWLSGGGQLHCKQLQLKKEAVVLTDLSLGLPRVTVPRERVVRLSTPTRNWTGTAMPPGCWVRLQDGSIVRAKEINGRLHEPRGEAAPLDRKSVVALWGDSSHYHEPTANVFPARYDAQVARPLKDVQFEVSELQLTGKEEERIAYSAAPLVWLAAPAKWDPEQPRLELVSGERLVFGDRQTLASWEAGRVTIRRGERTLSIPLAEVRSLVLP